MLVFRSEAHVDRWLGGRAPGETISILKVAELGQAWYEDRLAPEWRPRTREQNQAILDRLGLTGPFWRLG